MNKTLDYVRKSSNIKDNNSDYKEEEISTKLNFAFEQLGNYIEGNPFELKDILTLHLNTVYREIGKLLYKGKLYHTSMNQRYSKVAEILINPKTEIELEIQQTVCKWKGFSIQDPSCGEKVAIDTFYRNISFHYPNARVVLGDKSPNVYTDPDVSFKDITLPPEPGDQYDLTFIGHTIYYLTLEQYISSIIYRLYESKVLALTPATIASNYDFFIIWKSNGLYKYLETEKNNLYIEK